jgi:hypothetical protein
MLRQMTATAVMDHTGSHSPRQTRLQQAETADLGSVELERLAALLRFPARFSTTALVCRVGVHDLLFRAPKATTES